MRHDLLNPYPTDISEPSGILLSKLGGQDVPLPCLVHAAYQLVGVCLSQLLPDTAETTTGMHAKAKLLASCPRPSDEEAKAALTEAKAMHGPVTDLILKQLLAFAMAKLQEWLAGK